MVDKERDPPVDINGDRETRYDGDRNDRETRYDGSAGRTPGDVRLPGPLRDRLEVVGEPAGEGGEGSVYLVFDRQAGEQRILKLYNRDVQLDRETVDILLDVGRDPDGQRYVVRLYEADKVEGRWYELQEHCVGGSLGKPEDMWSVSTDQLVRQVGQALSYLQGRLVFRDVKPSNLLLRTSGTGSAETVDIVLGDFGSARAMADFSVQYDRWAGTVPYLPPEAFTYVVTPGWDWWSFGMVVAEHAMGRHPLAYDDGTLPDVLQVPSLVANYPVDISGITDERVRLLCQGLLTRDYQRRWRAEEFRRWSTGEEPPLPSDDPGEPTELGTGESATSEAEQVTHVQFAGQTFTDSGELAVAFQEQWRYAVDRLVTDRNPEWIASLETFLRERELLGAAQTVAYLSPATPNPSKALAGLLLDMSQDIEPVFDRMSLTPEGLRDAANDVLIGRLTSARLEAVRRAGVLDLWRAVPGIADGQRISRPWDDAAEHIDRLVAETAVAGFTLHRAAGDRAKAWILLTLLGDGYQVQLDEALAAAQETEATETDWWVAIAAEGETAPAAAALAVTTARQAGLLAADLEARDELSEQEDRAEMLDDTELEQLRDSDERPLEALARRGCLLLGLRWRRGSSRWGRRFWPDRRWGSRRFTDRPSQPGLLAFVLGGGLVGFHMLLLGMYEAPLRDYFESTNGESLLSDPLGTLDLLTSNVGVFLALVAAHAVMVLVGWRSGDRIQLGPPSVSRKAHAVVVRVTQAALIVAVVVSGLVDVLLSDAAGGYRDAGFPDGFLPDGGRVLGGLFLVIVAWSAVALARTAIALARSVVDRYA